MKRNVALVSSLGIVVAVALVAYGFVAMRPPTTTSPKTQHGLTLVEIVRGAPRALPGSSFLSNGYFEPVDAACTLIWKQAADRKPNAPRPYFANLTASDGRKQSLPVGSGGGGYFGVCIPWGYSPSFVNCSLTLVDGKGREYGTWRLSNLPRPARRLADSEKPVLKAKLGDFEATASPMRYVSKGGTVGALSLGLDMKGPWKPDVEYWLSIRLGRSSWARQLEPKFGGGFMLRPPAVPGYSRTIAFAQETSQVEGFAKLEEKATYAEVVKIKGLKLERPSGKYPNQYEVVWDKGTFQAVTPSGIHIFMEPFRRPYQSGIFSLYVTASADADTVFLKDSPLCRRTGKPVSLWLSVSGPDGLNAGSTLMSVVPGSKGKVGTAPSGKIDPKYSKPGPLPTLKLVVTQSALLRESTARFVGPVRDVQVPFPLFDNFEPLGCAFDPTKVSEPGARR